MCFLIGGYTVEGDVLLGSVSDDPYDVRTFLRRVVPERGLSHIGTELISMSSHTLTERGYFANPGETTRGVNEAGVAFTCAMILESTPPEEATAYVAITTEIMSQCRSVQEAIDLFEASSAIAPPYSVLLADREGDLAHLEVGRSGAVVYERYSRARPGTVLAVNCYLTQSKLGLGAPGTTLADRDNNNAARRERGEELAQQLDGELSVERIASLLSDHCNRERDPMKNPIFEGWGYSICNHGTRRSDSYEEENLPWGTVSAEILDPSSRTFYYAYGWPCGGSPEYGDQLYQEGSWGEFSPFCFPVQRGAPGTMQLSTPLGGSPSAFT